MNEAWQRGPLPGVDPILILEGLRHSVDAALDQLRNTGRDSLLEARYVGRVRIPSNVLGLIFHAAEHAQRHIGQIIATSKVVGPGTGRRPPVVCVIGRKIQARRRWSSDSLRN